MLCYVMHLSIILHIMCDISLVKLRSWAVLAKIHLKVQRIGRAFRERVNIKKEPLCWHHDLGCNFENVMHA